MLDYDIVIIGGNLAGRYAAEQARRWRARVALVELTESQLTANLAMRHEQYYAAFLEAGKLMTQEMKLTASSGSSWGNFSLKSGKNWQDLQQWILLASEREFPSLTQLMGEGIDVIMGEGEFQLEEGEIAYSVNQRKLYSRAYLVALSSLPKIPPIEGLAETGYYTRQTLYHLLKLPKKAESLVIIGGDPSGVEMAQIFAKLGCQVTIIVKSPHILGKEDSDASFLIQATMEAQGIKVLTETEVTQARQIDQKKWVQAGDRAIEVDEIILAAGWETNLASLNPLGVSMTSHQTRQTNHEKIYAFSEVQNGYIFPQFAEYKAMIALKNILFFPIFKADPSRYNSIPWAIFTEPEIARVGLSTQQAKKRYKEEDILIINKPFKSLAKSQIRGEITGFCQLMIQTNGKILGATIVGNQASEMISIIALAITQGINIKIFAQSPMIPSTFSVIIHEIAQEWAWQNLQRQKLLYNFLDNFFHWRRSGVI